MQKNPENKRKSMFQCSSPDNSLLYIKLHMMSQYRVLNSNFHKSHFLKITVTLLAQTDLPCQVNQVEKKNKTNLTKYS